MHSSRPPRGTSRAAASSAGALTGGSSARPRGMAVPRGVAVEVGVQGLAGVGEGGGVGGGEQAGGQDLGGQHDRAFVGEPDAAQRGDGVAGLEVEFVGGVAGGGSAGDVLAGGGGVVAGGADHGGDAEVAVQVFDDGGLGDEGAAAVAADDELAVFQGAQGLAEGGARDLELLGQVGFRGQRAAGLVDALLDRVG